MSIYGIDEPLAAFPDPNGRNHVLDNPPPSRLRDLSSHLETPTEFGSPAYTTQLKSRSADTTKDALDDRFTPADWAVIRRAIEFVNDPGNDVVCIDRQVGTHASATFTCRLYIPKPYARIGLALQKLLDPVEINGRPDFVTIQLPQFEGPKIRILPETGITCILGSDYTGEAKKSFLRLFMYAIKQQGGLGLHAGSKRVRVKRDEDLQTVGQLFLGLSATGKTTLTCHDFGLTSPESTAMLQDDVCALLPDGTVAGSEGRGLYIKTLGLTPDEHGPLYTAATKPDSILENVAVGEYGSVDFDSDRHSANARAVVRRAHLPNAAEDISLDRLDQVFFITRNPLMPPIARLTPAEASVAFMLGESIETSAGDPDRAGEAIRVVGTNPFIIGDEGREGNRFYSLLSTLDIDCFVLNTGRIGADAVDIRVDDTIKILTAAARDDIEWRRDEAVGLTIPTQIPDLEIDRFYPPDLVDNYGMKLSELREQRQEYLAQFDSLNEAIENAVY